MARTVLITGATGGIGLGLALAFHARGDRVIVAGRDPGKLDAVRRDHAGLDVLRIDVTDPASVSGSVAEIVARYPDLDTVVNNAGVQNLIDFRHPVAMERARTEIETNLTGLVAVTAAVLPHLLAQPRATLIQVGSGLGYTPLNAAPVYSATKAAVHAFSAALRAQLAGTSVKVLTLVPPVVETDLHRDQGRRPPGAMRLDAFVREAMTALDRGEGEAAVGKARMLRIGSRLAPALFSRIINGRR